MKLQFTTNPFDATAADLKEMRTKSASCPTRSWHEIHWFFAVFGGMTRFLEAWKAAFALEGSEMLARRKRVRERSTWSVLKLDSRPERVLEQGAPKVRCINNHTVSIQQLTVFLGLVSNTTATLLENE